MNNISKISKRGIVIIATSIITIGNISLGDDWFDDISHGYGTNVNEAVDEISVIGTDQVQENNGYKIIDTIKNAINRVLGMLSLIALVLCLWGGFQMLTAGGDDSKVKAGTKVLKNAAIGLAVIGLAWLIIAFVFRIISRTAASTGDTGTGTAPYPGPLPEA